MYYQCEKYLMMLQNNKFKDAKLNVQQLKIRLDISRIYFLITHYDINTIQN